MPVRTKFRRSASPKRHSAAVAARPTRSARGHKIRELKPIKRHLRKAAPFAAEKASAVPGPGHSFTKAMRYLDTLTHFERLRIVRYNNQNFDLDRMRTLLRRMRNPQSHFKSIHVAGTKGKGSTCAIIASMLQA